MEGLHDGGATRSLFSMVRFSSSLASFCVSVNGAVVNVSDNFLGFQLSEALNQDSIFNVLGFQELSVGSRKQI